MEIAEYGRNIQQDRMRLHARTREQIEKLQTSPIYNQQYISKRVPLILGYFDGEAYSIVVNLIDEMPYEQELLSAVEELEVLYRHETSLNSCRNRSHEHIEVFLGLMRKSVNPDTDLPDYITFREEFKKDFLTTMSSAKYTGDRTYLDVIANFNNLSEMGLVSLECLHHQSYQGIVLLRQWKDTFQSFADFVRGSDLIEKATQLRDKLHSQVSQQQQI